MKALTTAGLTKLIQLIKSSFIKTTDTVTTNTVTLATVATSGSYNDLSNKPTIPTVDQTYDETSVNAQSGVAIAGKLADYAETSDIPTTISDLTDDTSTNPIDKAESVVDNNSGSLTFWSGTKAEYDAIATKDSNTIYNVEDTTSPIISILDSLYPVGAIYIGTMSACPLATLGVGTWQLVATDKVLQGAGTRGSVGNTLNESLPNIKGSLSNYFSRNGSSTSSSNVLYQDDMTSISVNSGSQAGGFGALHINAANASSTYQDNAPVQQDAYLVNIWERIS